LRLDTGAALFLFYLRSRFRVWNDASFNPAAALFHAENDRLVAEFLRHRAAPPVVSFINLDVPFEDLEAIDLIHELADLMTDAPTRLVGHADCALNFLPRDAVPRRDKQVDDVKPHLQRRAGVLEDRSGARVNVIAAMSARIGRHSGQLVERGLVAALPANVAQSVPDFHNARQASVVAWKLREKFANGKRLDAALFLSGFRGALTLAGCHVRLL
jgi:hypothetical protein